MTRNINGNANVKNAEAGLRQNALLTYRIWVKVRGALFIVESRQWPAGPSGGVGVAELVSWR